MTRSRAKGAAIAYPFHPAPRELDARWMQCSFYERALGGELFRVSGGRPMPCGSDWSETLCRMLAVSGRERPNVKRALRGLADEGLLTVSANGLVVVHFAPPALSEDPTANDSEPPSDDVQADSSSPSDDPQMTSRPTSGLPQVDIRSHPDDIQVDIRSTSGRHQVASRFESSAGNDSHHDRQIRVDQSRSDQRDPPLPPKGGAWEPDPSSWSLDIREGWGEAYFAANAGAPPVLTGQPLTAAVTFACSVAKAHGKTPREAARAIAAAALELPQNQRKWALSELDPFAASQAYRGPVIPQPEDPWV